MMLDTTQLCHLVFIIHFVSMIIILVCEVICDSLEKVYVVNDRTSLLPSSLWLLS